MTKRRKLLAGSAVAVAGTGTAADATRSRRATMDDAMHVDEGDLAQAYGLRRRVAYALVAIIVGVAIAGFWNFRAVDGFGREFIAGNTIGDTAELSHASAAKGLGFGFVFAAVAGLAATFTACNCVVFAMIPGLACSTDRAESRKAALRALGVFTAGVLVISVFYGIFVGFLGPAGIEAMNIRAVRLAQAQAVFTGLGLVMLLWGALELGFLDRWVRGASPLTRAFFAMPTTKAGIMGVLVGLFSVGRPFPVFREFLTYAATVNNPAYGAAVMAVQGIGQIAVMVALFVVLVYAFGDRLTRWVQAKPHQPRLVSAVALLLGGAYFVYYWGLAFMFDIGRWGFKLGWYG